MSAARAFLRPAMKRNNVRVEMNALATRILFEGQARRRRRVRAERRDQGAARRPRGHRLGRLDQFAAAAATLRRRPRRNQQGARHRDRARQRAMSGATCRIMSASTTPTRAASRRSTRSCARGGASMLVGMQYLLTRSRAAGAVDEQCRRLLPHRSVASRARTCSSISRHSRPSSRRPASGRS